MRNKLQQAKRIVIKVGTSSLIYPNGNINLKAIDQLAFTLSDLSNQGKEIILVSSGAIGVGLNKFICAPNDNSRTTGSRCSRPSRINEHL